MGGVALNRSTLRELHLKADRRYGPKERLKLHGGPGGALGPCKLGESTLKEAPLGIGVDEFQGALVCASRIV